MGISIVRFKKIDICRRWLFQPKKISPEEAEKYLNKIGEEGWEIIDLDFDFLIHDTGAFVGVAKRRKN